jgi:hypothetical protein
VEGLKTSVISVKFTTVQCEDFEQEATPEVTAHKTKQYAE